MAMFFRLRRCLPALLLFFAFARSAGAQSAGAAHIAGEADFGTEAPSLFPQAFFNSYLEARDARDASQSYGAATETEFKALSLPSYREPILLNNDILAFYGHPRSRNMGILGRYTKEELNEMLDILALEYRKAGGRNVYKALYIIFGTVWPGGEIGIIQESLLREYIDFALEKDMLVFIDHQIGRYTPAESVKKMLPWLKYPNVHLALDPEWRTTRPMEEIGTVTADEINQAQRIMEDYMIENRIPGERFLVIHQFNYIMISNRERVVSNFSKVTLIHCADGFGAPHVKKSSYANNAKATNMPIKAFKLFYNFNIPGAGYDYPLLTPKEVFELKPRPYIVMYQ